MTIALVVLALILAIPTFFFRLPRYGFKTACLRTWKMITTMAMIGIIIDVLTTIVYAIYMYQSLT